MRTLVICLCLTLISTPAFGIEQLSKQSRFETGQKNIEKHRRDIDTDLRHLFFALQGRVAFGESDDGVDGENIEGEFQVVADTGNADTEFQITHTLNRIPNGYIVTKNTGAGSIYDSTTHTTTLLKLKSTAANAAITVFIF